MALAPVIREPAHLVEKSAGWCMTRSWWRRPLSTPLPHRPVRSTARLAFALRSSYVVRDCRETRLSSSSLRLRWGIRHTHTGFRWRAAPGEDRETEQQHEHCTSNGPADRDVINAPHIVCPWDCHLVMPYACAPCLDGDKGDCEPVRVG